MRKSPFFRKRSGNVLVVFATGLVVLLGLAALSVDYANFVVRRWKVQAAVDAAALGGAYELLDLVGAEVTDYTPAENVANVLAASNIGASYSVSFPSSKTCQVVGSLTSNTYFAAVLGIRQVTVSARALASISPVSGGTGIRPFGVEEPIDSFVFGETYLLKLGPQDENDDGSGDGYAHHGNFHAVAIGGTGSNVYRDNVKYGSDEVVRVGDWLPTEPGNMTGPTDQGVDYILQQEIIEEGVDYIMNQDQISWEWYRDHPEALEGSPRVITIPVIGDWAGVYGRSDVQVVGFANFFLEGTEGTGVDCRVTGRFIKSVVPGAYGGGNHGYGAYMVRLVQ